jgi:hypothetical protein
MPPSIDYKNSPGGEPVEFSIEDALLNTWVDEASVYLRLETDQEEATDES